MAPRILMIRIPKSIHPCPIIDAISEIRFNPSTDPDAVYGVLFSAFRRNFSVTEKLPITQIPQEIRESDGSLFWQPHYRMKNDDFVIQIGPRVISVGVRNEYCGWNAFQSAISDVVDEFRKTEVAEEINRVSVRYVNFFQGDNIYENLRIKIQSTDEIGDLSQNSLNLQSELLGEDKQASKLTITNSAAVNRDGKSHRGSVIDIDVMDSSATLDDLKEKIERVHEKEKELFFSLLKQEFVDTLNPTY